MASPLMSHLLRVCRELARQLTADPTTRRTGGSSGAPQGGSAKTAGSPARSRYPGDFHGPLTPVYAPQPDGQPDPGEIVWTWVPYEEDHSQGKDRPVLLIGRDRQWLLGLQLTSKDHARDAAQERAEGRLWVDIGTGAWDRAGRPSEVRVNRIIRVDPAGIRREGAVLREDVFRRVAAAIRS